jgi:hypothetical protein
MLRLLEVYVYSRVIVLGLRDRLQQPGNRLDELRVAGDTDVRNQGGAVLPEKLLAFGTTALQSAQSEGSLNQSSQRIASLSRIWRELRPPEQSDFLTKVAAAAGVEYRVERRAFDPLKRATEDGKHVGQNPAGVAAAALYAGAQALGEPLTQATVVEAAGVSTVTLSRHWQAFRPYLE